jgi:hypothetical protein
MTTGLQLRAAVNTAFVTTIAARMILIKMVLILISLFLVITVSASVVIKETHTSPMAVMVIVHCSNWFFYFNAQNIYPISYGIEIFFKRPYANNRSFREDN